MRRTDRDPSTLKRKKSLVESYETHDIGEAHFIENTPYDVEAFGIDKRHDDEGLIYDDKPDLRLWWQDTPIALVDVKTKTSDKWMGQWNERHYIHYWESQFKHELPVFVVMYLVQNDEVKDGFWYEVGDEVFDGLKTSEDPSNTISRFPDGNRKVVVEHDYRKPLNRLDGRLEEAWLERHEFEPVPEELRETGNI